MGDEELRRNCPGFGTSILEWTVPQLRALWRDPSRPRGPPEWWTPADDEGANFPPGFEAVAVGATVSARWRTSRKASHFTGALVGNGEDVVVRPARPGKPYADALRAALGCGARATSRSARTPRVAHPIPR